MTNYPTATQMTLNNATQNVINARDLYDFLGLAKKQYYRWVQNILIPTFIDNTDYIVNIDVANKLSTSTSPAYLVTIDTAKHIALMSNTEVGKEYRQYLIILEKEYIARLEAQPKLPSHKSHYTIRDFIAFKGMSNLPAFDTRKLAQKLSKMCKENGIELQYKSSKIYDTINMYPYEVLVAYLA